MAVASVLAVMNGAGKRDIYSFFPKSHDLCSEDQNVDLANVEHVAAVQSNTPIPQNKRRKVDTEDGSAHIKSKTQRTLKDILNPAATAAPLVTESARHAIHHSAQNGVSCNNEQDPAAACHGEPGPNISNGSVPGSEADPFIHNIHHPVVHIPATPPIHVESEQQKDLQPKTPPKKLLRLKANGTFASPPTVDPAESSAPSVKRRGRPRKSLDYREKKLLVVIKYAEISKDRQYTSSRIERIMSGEERAIPYNKKPPTTKTPRTPRKPFAIFESKAKPTVSTAIVELPRKASAVTPGKLRTQTLALTERRDDSSDIPYKIGSSLLKDRLLTRQPGAREPAWPHRGTSHVRGLDRREREQLESLHDTRQSFAPSRRKGKTVHLPLPKAESVLDVFSASLTPEQEGLQRDDGFCEPHPALRVPEKCFTTGVEILEWIKTELSSVSATNYGVSSATTGSRIGNAHSAVKRLCDEILTSLTAWDLCQGESSSWTQKYAPNSADTVLQPQHEMRLLRSWLESHTITAVESGDVSDSKTVKHEIKLKKRRPKRRDDLDDFIVDSDEDSHSMSELLMTDDDAARANREVPKSVVQDANTGTKLSNAVLLSGPHGCGKTAAAYAIARELGFKVFEIGSHERRSGKDVIDRIGNMTANHLVKHHGEERDEALLSARPDQHEEALQHDLSTGRQGTMNSFFKPSSVTKETMAKSVVKEQAVKKIKEVLKKPPKAQKQSLILLEEVDILFKEDKDFWTTIFKLILSSKRPFIMTCTDETLVPIQAVSFYAILRFNAVPLELATDYLLLVAAKEGHLLSREAVSNLYRSKREDLRASITELNFWCQMGIGDPRGGLGWLYQRWPPGSDIDQHGRRLRVVSKATLPESSHSFTATSDNKEERMLQTWQEFGLSPADQLEWNRVSATKRMNESATATDPEQKRQALKSYSTCIDTLSAADVYSDLSYPNLPQLRCDQPEIPEKARANFIEGQRLLQTDEDTWYPSLDKELAISTILYAVKSCTGALESHQQLSPRRHQTGAENLRQPATLTRRDFGCLDALAAGEDTPSSTGAVQMSVIDGPFAPLVIDIAPYVRNIVRFDLALHQQREFLSGLSDDAGETRKAKRVRTTRAARSALEGGQRATTRRERWFMMPMDESAVLATAGSEWHLISKESVGVVDLGSGEEEPSSSADPIA